MWKRLILDISTNSQSHEQLCGGGNPERETFPSFSIPRRSGPAQLLPPQVKQDGNSHLVRLHILRDQARRDVGTVKKMFCVVFIAIA